MKGAFMPMFKIGVEKKMRSKSFVVIDAENGADAIKMVREQINNGSLKPERIQWDEPIDEKDSLVTYGEIL